LERFLLVESCDVGSLPFSGDFNRFLEGATGFSASSIKNSDSVKYFERRVIEAYIDKIKVGINLPNYPQFRDMNKMFLENIVGIESIKGGYIINDLLSLNKEKAFIPEVQVLKNHAKEIHEKIGQFFRIRVSITGPYTLSCLFVNKYSRIFTDLAGILLKIMQNIIFKGKHGEVDLIALDEPTFGLIDDPLLDFGSEGREALSKAWEVIFAKAQSKGVRTSLHLHDTSKNIFWDIKSLNIIESHIEDPVFFEKKTKDLLESTDKFLKASICPSNFDTLIAERLNVGSQSEVGESLINQRVAETWKGISSGKIDPTIFLESTKKMKKRLIELTNRFGIERIPYAGPECGLINFPTYECAMKCLKKTAKTVENL
jgi:5-methyltetrahydropteroyltriglutamate--homocysteine methyltransferase